MGKNELRVGNLIINDYGEINPVYGVDEKSILTKVEEDGWSICFKPAPIPLTEEWLLKFGFKRFPWGLSIDKLLFKDNLNHPCEELTLEVGNGFKATVKTVHETQNLYKSFTGKELKLL